MGLKMLLLNSEHSTMKSVFSLHVGSFRSFQHLITTVCHSKLQVQLVTHLQLTRNSDHFEVDRKKFLEFNHLWNRKKLQTFYWFVSFSAFHLALFIVGINERSMLTRCMFWDTERSLWRQSRKLVPFSPGFLQMWLAGQMIAPWGLRAGCDLAHCRFSMILCWLEEFYSFHLPWIIWKLLLLVALYKEKKKECHADHLETLLWAV